MKVIGLKRTPDKTSALHRKYVDEIYGFDSLPYVLGASDFVINALPYTPDTHYLFTLDQFALMKPSSVYMNVGRGKTVKEADLIKALKD